jgi:mono/diheme cytochrome c family protein
MAASIHSYGALAGASILLMTATVWASRIQPAQPPAPQLTTREVELFESRIRPLLIDNCFSCHTDDEKGGLRLDSRDRMLKGGESGPAIVPGDPESSLLIKAVRHAPGVEKMPRNEPKLSDLQIAALVEWIKAGAPWPATAVVSTVAAPKADADIAGITAEHRAFWSFQPLGRPAVPNVTTAGWARTDIDRFILARLEKEGLKPVKAADKLTLIRRATLDLTGLPPTFEEVDAFEKDASPDAFAKVVDRLLASPHYGVAWGRMWLDVARYGEDDPRSLDPKGRGYAPYPNAYLYRDWVIKAFNDDLPYDQFVKAQIAGDLLDDRSLARTLPALGFLGLGPWYYDNGAVEITRADERHDRVDVVTRGFLGLTVACARCHDHKYDPILAKDYYAIAGVFVNSDYHEYPLAPKSIVDDYKAQEKKIEQKEKLLAKFMQTESRQLAETLAFSASRYMQSAWKVTGEPKKDMARVANEDKLDFELFERWIKFLAKPPKFYPYLKDWQAMIKEGGTAAEAKKLGDEFQKLLLDVMFEKKDAEEENEIIRAKALPGTKKKKEANLPNEFVTNDDFCPGCGLELKSLSTEKIHFWTDVFERDLGEGFEAFASDIAYIKPGLLAFRGWGLERFLSAERRRHVEDLRADIKEMKKALPPKFTYVHGVRDAARPENLKVALRGNPMNLGNEVPRRFLSALSEREPAPFTRGSGRLELADIIATHPLAARVIVNRVWKGHFGTGIVDTPSNFGSNGERPTHPELLEYLATFFVSKGMSIKTLHREIMLSAVYQLSARNAAANAEKDGGNRLYWRANPRRMTAEQIRDSVLLVSGALEPKIGGASQELTPAFNRRTVYGKVSRYKLDQFLQLFDFPAATISAEQRFSTSVPLQRLFFMNSEFMQQQGELLARRVESEPDTRARIRKAYRLIYGREPVEAEIAAGAAYVAQEPMRAYEERKAEAAKKPDGTADKKKQTTGDADDDGDDEDRPRPMTGDGMMAGVVPGAGGKAEAKLLPVTAFGRYMKVLLSSGEFLFVS